MERSKLIVFFFISLYSFPTSLSKILIFRFRLVEEIEREILSIYKRSFTKLKRVRKRSLIYIKKRIGEIRLLYKIPTSIGLNSSIWLSKESLRSLFSKKEEIQVIKESGKYSF